MKKFNIETLGYRTVKATGGRHCSNRGDSEKELYCEDESGWFTLEEIESEVSIDVFSVLSLIDEYDVKIKEIKLLPTYKYFEYCEDNTSYEECKELIQTIKIK